MRLPVVFAFRYALERASRSRRFSGKLCQKHVGQLHESPPDTDHLFVLRSAFWDNRRALGRSRGLSRASLMPASTFTLIVWLLTAQAGASAAPPDRLAGVKALFAAADYEAALIVLSTEDVAAAPGADQYRALCLLALGRHDDVERLLETLIRRDPSFKMNVNEVTPRM